MELALREETRTGGRKVSRDRRRKGELPPKGPSDEQDAYLLELAGLVAEQQDAVAAQFPARQFSVPNLNQAPTRQATLTSCQSLQTFGKEHESNLYGSRPSGPCALVEFVYGDALKRDTVALCGDWNDWEPVLMEFDRCGLFKLVVRMPVGYHEYCFMVNGETVVSRGHPQNLQGTANWRNIATPQQKNMNNRKVVLTSVEQYSSVRSFIHALRDMLFSFTKFLFFTKTTGDLETGDREHDFLLRAWTNMKPSEVRDFLVPFGCVSLFMLIYICVYLTLGRRLM